MDWMETLKRAPEGALRREEMDGAVFTQALPGGRGRERRVALYPGATLEYGEYLAEGAALRPAPAHALEIFYCRAGRAGWRLPDGMVYLGAGECALRGARAEGARLVFPNGAYQGLRICIEPEAFAAAPPELVAQAQIDVGATIRRHLDAGDGRVGEGGQLAPLFSGFYGQPPELRLPMARLKFQELIFCLHRMEARPAASLRHSAEQIEVIRRVHDHLTRRLDARETIEELSRRFLINPSTLKEVFKEVYGNSIAAHIREHRMERAAELLRETDMSMAEVARAVGYESPSKFSAEFRKAFSLLPSQYRSAAR